MSRYLLALWMALVSAILVIAALAYFWNAQRTQIAEQRVEEILKLQMQPFRRSVSEVLQSYSVSLQRELGQFDPSDLQACVQLTRLPLVDEVVVINADRQLHFPRDSRLTTDRKSLVDEALQLLREQPNQPATNFGWSTWYHRRGIVLGFWWAQGSEWRTLIVLPRARWMSDVVARLPDSTDPSRGGLSKLPSPEFVGGLTQLVDVEGHVIYQWGTATGADWEALQSQSPTALLALDEPLEGWRLRVFTTPAQRQQLAGDSLLMPLVLAVVALATVLVLVGALVTVNMHRQLRLAASRVSFVNQVSHELRTPLTNIRMYADLLAQSLENNETEPETLERVAVIQGESQRLSRLISNVLQFARPDDRGAPRLTPAVLDELVEEVLVTFRPRLQHAGFSVELQLQTPEQRLLDTDAVEQILVNLIGNAEKYAAVGKYLRISTQSNEKDVTIDVQDHGPGVPAHQAERVFEPFVRLCDRLEDPSGTGIGLAIVRRLAQEHGGKCEIVPAPNGAHFRCRLESSVC